MNQLRPLEPNDIPQLVALRRRVYTQSAHQSDAALARYYQTLFFENPWYDARYPSFVQEGPSGETLGFVGSIPRPMLLGAERLTAVTATELMVTCWRAVVIPPSSSRTATLTVKVPVRAKACVGERAPGKMLD